MLGLGNHSIWQKLYNGRGIASQLFFFELINSDKTIKLWYFSVSHNKELLVFRITK